MKDVIIRQAKLEDIAILRRFEQGVIEAEQPFDPTLKKEKINYYNIEALINSPTAELVVAEWENQIVGSGYAKILEAEPFLQHQRYSHIGFIYVKPEHRGKGIVDKILDALKQWSIHRGITEIRLEVYKANARAIRAYEKAGFQQHMLVMRTNADEKRPG